MVWPQVSGLCRHDTSRRPNSIASVTFEGASVDFWVTYRIQPGPRAAIVVRSCLARPVVNRHVLRGNDLFSSQ